MDEKQTSELRSGVTAPFNKRINEALQFNPQMPFHIENNVSPSLLVGVLKGEQGTPGLPATLSVVKDNNNLVMLATSNIERGDLLMGTSTSLFGGTGTKSYSYVVPKGEKWILKGYTFDNTGTATITNFEVTIDQISPSVIMRLYRSSTAVSNASFFNEPIVLPENFQVRFTCEVSADTNGAGRSKLLYQRIKI